MDAVIEPLPARASQAADDSGERWDRANVHAFTGTYGDYLLGKVGKVFPDLLAEQYMHSIALAHHRLKFTVFAHYMVLR